MERLIIQGNVPLRGEIRVNGAKNAALPIMAACLLIEDTCYLKNIPHLTDIEVMGSLLQQLGADVEFKNREFAIDAACLLQEEAHSNLINMLRASVLILGPLLMRKGKAKVALPGGCNIGLRPIDLHLKGLYQMGARIQVEDGYIQAKAPSRLAGATINLGFPSVGATENIILAASIARGTTVIKNASRAPEVTDLCNFLQKAGAKISGIGTNTLTIEGVKYLSPVDYSIISDRIEAGTFMIAAGITGGEILLKDIEADDLKLPILKLRAMGMQIATMQGKIHVKSSSRLKPIKIKTMPHPGFPTDLQPQLTALACLSQGKSEIIETIFESRFSHVSELRKMGACVNQNGNKIETTGVPSLHGARVVASDIRGAAALVLAGLAAQGETEILNYYYIYRGYEKFEEKLTLLGAIVKREEVVT